MKNLIFESLEVNRVDVALENRPLPNDALTAGAHTVTIAEIQNGVIRMDPTADRALRRLLQLWLSLTHLDALLETALIL